MSEKEHKSLNDTYGVVVRWVRDPKTMKIFRDSNIAFRERLNAAWQKSKDWTQQLNEWKVKSPEYQEYQKAREKEDDLIRHYKALYSWLCSNSEIKVGSTKWIKKQKQYGCLEKKLKHAQAQRKKKEEEFDKARQAWWTENTKPGGDPIAALAMPHPDTPALARLKAIFGFDENDGTVFERELGLLADYVILTILHDKSIIKSGSKARTEAINNGIWPEKEEWAESLWGELQSDNPEIITEVNLCLDRVKEDLLAQLGSGDHNQADSTADTGTGIEHGQTITLKQFFNDYCDLSQKPDIISKCEMLLRADRKKGEIKLPLVGTRNDYHTGQTYLFYRDELLNEWPAYKKILTTLPQLKKSGDK